MMEPEGYLAAGRVALWLALAGAVVVDVERGGRSFRTHPKIYQIFGGGDWMTRTEPYIHRTIFGDLYIAPAQYEPHATAPEALGGVLTLEVSTRPLMGFLWLGVLIVVRGGGTATWRRTRELSE